MAGNNENMDINILSAENISSVENVTEISIYFCFVYEFFYFKNHIHCLRVTDRYIELSCPLLIHERRDGQLSSVTKQDDLSHCHVILQ